MFSFYFPEDYYILINMRKKDSIQKYSANYDIWVLAVRKTFCKIKKGSRHEIL